MIPGDAVHPRAREALSAEDVAAADDHGHLHAKTEQFLNLERDALEDFRVDAVVG